MVVVIMGDGCMQYPYKFPFFMFVQSIECSASLIYVKIEDTYEIAGARAVVTCVVCLLGIIVYLLLLHRLHVNDTG